ncbi:peptidyl-tRNA hydrolase [Allomyces macrogynus ATCC 38327]|uniref:peptidyl-tRNA hydrolase n=1 Tax=Allomyces macrogynus (strain ATCC 38327) TaxID=578462 RepID=A0A0L0S8T5_ALLM3|nr:peptidyl-tRNA hydrolase [Allomyces macrogynus ATCC 38327]|eukprot:KNE58887.1 peptidyl-tRNA hydrolase [Allomyces macrogynus ATCC 38327]
MLQAVKSFATDLLRGDPAAVWHSAQILATALVSGTLGAWLVAGRTQSVQAAISATAARPKHDKSTSNHESSSSAEDSDAESDASSDDDAPADGSAPVIDARKYSDFKMVLVVRNDLGMTKGKVAAQCCHACLAAYKHCVRHNPKLAEAWEYTGQAKVALKVNSEDEMLELEALAQSLSLSAKSIRDAGRTQIAAGSRTVLAIGPGPVEIIDQVTKHLKLY